MRTSLASYSLLLLGAGLGPLRAQEELRAWRTFTRVDGLPSNGVLDVLEDRRGDVWVACYGGVGRYLLEEGRWTSFERVRTRDGAEVSLDDATSLAEQDDSSPGDRRGTIWIGTDGQGLLARLPDGTWEQITSESSLDALPCDHVHSLLFARDGSLWVGLDGSVCRRDPRTLTWEVFGPQVPEKARRLPLPGNREVYTLHEDGVGRIWVAGYDLGAHAWLGDRWVSYDEKGIYDPLGVLTNTSPRGCLKHRYIYAVRNDAEGKLWFLGFGGGVSVLRPDGKEFEDPPPNFRPASQSTCDVALDRRTNQLWFATYEGITQLSADRKTTRHHRSGQNFAPGFFRRAHYGERSGTLWFANRGGGLVARLSVGYRLLAGQDLDDAGELDPDVRGGLAVDPEGRVWGATLHRVFLREPDGAPVRTWSLAELGLDGASDLQCLHADPRGHVWVGSTRGLTRWDGERWTVVVPEVATEAGMKRLEKLDVWQIASDSRERLWLATRGDGGLALDAQRAAWIQLEPDRSDDAQLSLPDPTIYCIFEDRERAIWFGTWNGLARWNEAAPEGERWQVFDEKDGLTSARVYAIQQDTDGVLWLGTLRAVHRRGQDGRFEPIHAEQSQGRLEDGNYCFRILRTEDDSLWFAILGSGLVRYNARKGQWTLFQLPEDLAGVPVRGVATGKEGRFWIATSRGLISYEADTARPQVWLPTGNPTVLSNEGGGSFFALGRDVLQRTPPEELRYRFRVDDGAWGPYQSEPRTRVEGLDSGVHRLEVQAFDRDFNASASANHLFTVSRPWWQNSYVWGLAAGVLLLLLAGALVLRALEERRRSDLERAETLSAAVSGIVSGEMPSFLGPQSAEGSAGVLIHSDAAEYERLLRSGLRLVPDVRLSTLAQEVIAVWQQRSPDIAFDLRVQPGEQGANLDPEKLRLAIDHLVRNAVEALREEDRSGKVAIEIARTPRRPWRSARVVLRVIDDAGGIPDEVLHRMGTPFNSFGKSRHAGLGLYHCHQIATLHRGSLHLRRIAPRGTEVELELPTTLQA